MVFSYLVNKRLNAIYRRKVAEILLVLIQKY